jgi:hypothetical protein
VPVASIRPGPRGARERFWPRRLRWRLLGAWRWPAFLVFTAVDGVLLHLLPPIGSDIDLVFGLIVASFGNLALLSIVDLLARFWERKRVELGRPGGPPTAVVMDRIAGGLLLIGAVGLLAAGLGNRRVIVSETEATEENAHAVERWVPRFAPPEYRQRDNIEAANTIRLADGFFRTCIPDDTRLRQLCLFVDTKRDPASVRRDPSTTPNSEYPGGRNRR